MLDGLKGIGFLGVATPFERLWAPNAAIYSQDAMEDVENIPHKILDILQKWPPDKELPAVSVKNQIVMEFILFTISNLHFFLFVSFWLRLFLFATRPLDCKVCPQTFGRASDMSKDPRRPSGMMLTESASV